MEQTERIRDSAFENELARLMVAEYRTLNRLRDARIDQRFPSDQYALMEAAAIEAALEVVALYDDRDAKRASGHAEVEERFAYWEWRKAQKVQYIQGLRPDWYQTKSTVGESPIRCAA
ncbi:MAG: hypothetical protein M0027_00045 [Candidatus Dormibacteraeota bacterium]|jgi:hypothetical protein|nr:hypothetical protein [Candidatus Dormibacteraeota bacterium]